MTQLFEVDPNVFEFLPAGWQGNHIRAALEEWKSILQPESNQAYLFLPEVEGELVGIYLQYTSFEGYLF